MKIGIFDSGMGGLIVARSLINKLSQYDYVFLGDTARVPYGNRSSEAVYRFTKEAVEYLFAQGCQLIIIACNTASAEALRRLQQEYLPGAYPDRRILGVLIPSAEAVAQAPSHQQIGVLATTGTVNSNTFQVEITKLLPESVVHQMAAPLLVPLVEYDGIRWAEPILQVYLNPLLKANIDTLVLGCTHYPALKQQIRQIMGDHITIVSQDDIIPEALAQYLERHPDLEKQLSQEGKRNFQVTDLTVENSKLASKLFSETVDLKAVKIDK
jgi:glutamate racemase